MAEKLTPETEQLISIAYDLAGLATREHAKDSDVYWPFCDGGKDCACGASTHNRQVQDLLTKLWRIRRDLGHEDPFPGQW